MKIICILSLFTFHGICHAQTIMGGAFFTDTTITFANSPYHVTSNVLVPSGVHVSVEPGVQFLFDPAITWTVEGEFQAIGIPGDSIRFELYPGNANKWGGIIFSLPADPYDTTNGTGCILNYCVITNAGINSAIWIEAASVRILHSDISQCDGGIVAYASGTLIKHTHIHHSTFQAITTLYAANWPQPVWVDSCEINHIGAGSNDAMRLTARVVFSNNCVHHISSTFGALSIFEGPAIVVSGNNFYDNNTSAIIIINGPDSTVSITNNNFINNPIHISKSECYGTPVIIGNNFMSCGTYHIYCTDQFGLGGPICRPLPPGLSFYTLDMQQNYFAHTSGAQLASAVYDLYDNWIGRTIIAYDTSVVTPYSNNMDCAFLPDTSVSVTEHIKENQYSLFPNPFQDKLVISSVEDAPVLFILYDNTGRKLMHKAFTKSITLHTGQLGKGIYLYEVKDKNGKGQSGKLIKD